MPVSAPRTLERLSALDLVEALHLAHAAAALHELDVLPLLSRGATVAQLAHRHELDAKMLRAALDYLAMRTKLVRKSRGRYVATPHWLKEGRFLIDLYALAYRDNAVRLVQSLRTPALAAATVDRVWHAKAFDDASAGHGGVLAGLVRQLGFNRVLDLGCSTGRMLNALAVTDASFIGWGLDLNPTACKAARALLRASGVASRVRIFTGDALRMDAALPPRVREAICAVTASQVANGLFAAGPKAVVDWLRRMRKALPERPLLIADYCARLGTAIKPMQRETLLHDFAQVISGQGVPPSTLKSWQTIYRQAGCRLLHVIEDKRNTSFVHLLKL